MHAELNMLQRTLREQKRNGVPSKRFTSLDTDGKLRHETVRFKNPKGFSQRHPVPTASQSGISAVSIQSFTAYPS